VSGLTSIVIPCHDNLLYTALCLESIARHTPEPHEVVVVDNGCTDATAEWSAARGARVVRAPFNRGFAGGVNLGLAAAEGDVAVILNNDALATPGWLAGLRGALARELRGTGREATRLSGLCMAIARPVLERVGGFDTRFAVGNLEDDDYGLRSRLAGFRLWIADDSYVHHFGHRTFAIIDEDYDALLADNAARYALKWDLPLDRDPRGLLPPRGWDPARDRLPLPSAAASSRVPARR
jgi:GT2 family glycosyltransferase